MAKGDEITVVIETGGGTMTETISATKAGRSVRQRRITRQKMTWLEIEEMTKAGKPTGRIVAVRVDRVVAVREKRQET